MFHMRVARENMTLRCSHHCSGDKPVRPASSSLAQSNVAPLRSVWPCDSVEVRQDACVRTPSGARRASPSSAT
eukprot:9466745-Pyramimonas_sp.AAC.1